MAELLPRWIAGGAGRRLVTVASDRYWPDQAVTSHIKAQLLCEIFHTRSMVTVDPKRTSFNPLLARVTAALSSFLQYCDLGISLCGR